MVTLSHSFLPPLLLSLKVAGWAIAINAVLGVGLGYVFARKRFYGKEFLDTFLTLPLVLPPTVLGYYLLLLVSHRTTLGQWLNAHGISLIFTWQGAVLATTVVTFPLVFKPSRSAFEQVPLKYETAASCLGSKPLATFFYITLPLAWHGILAGLLLAFARGLGEFGATLMVAGNIPNKTQILSTAIYEAVQAGRDQQAHFMVILISMVSISILLSSKKIISRKQNITVY